MELWECRRSAPLGGVVIAVDLAHGENPKGLNDLTYKNQTLTEGMLTVLTDYTFVYFAMPSMRQTSVSRTSETR
ncbi:hypothetical protein [Thermococcus peptonophilus]|uniref:hypothetical protein n=1 Tax=Thermococcus peptonophilus TaxID=53952 RepID=UPI000AFE50DD